MSSLTAVLISKACRTTTDMFCCSVGFVSRDFIPRGSFSKTIAALAFRKPSRAVEAVFKVTAFWPQLVAVACFAPEQRKKNRASGEFVTHSQGVADALCCLVCDSVCSSHAQIAGSAQSLPCPSSQKHRDFRGQAKESLPNGLNRISHTKAKSAKSCHFQEAKDTKASNHHHMLSSLFALQYCLKRLLQQSNHTEQGEPHADAAARSPQARNKSVKMTQRDSFSREG